MTEEEKKQKALDYIEKTYPTNRIVERRNEYIAFIHGIDSREDEVKELEKALAFTEDVVDIQKKQLDKFRKPWISVDDEDNQPEIGEQIIIEFGEKARMILKYTGKELFKTWDAHHWMHIPENNKE